MPIWIFVILALVFGGLGVVFILVAQNSKRKAAEAAQWPTVHGEIVQSEVREHTSTDDEGTTSTTYEPLVKYHYVVKANEYTGTRIGFGVNQFDRNKAYEISSRYSVGQIVSVHFDPKDPAKSVLETVALGANIFSIVGWVFAGIGVLVLLIGIIVALV